jgi:hypothetical protein
MLTVLETYEGYQMSTPISNVLTVTVETHGTVDGADDARTMLLTFYETAGAWYLFEDISQLHY